MHCPPLDLCPDICFTQAVHFWQYAALPLISEQGQRLGVPLRGYPSSEETQEEQGGGEAMGHLYGKAQGYKKDTQTRTSRCSSLRRCKNALACRKHPKVLFHVATELL